MANDVEYTFEAAIDCSTRELVTRLLDGWKFKSEDQQIHIESLEGGANNVNLILNAGSDRSVLKLRAPDCELFGTNPSSSIVAQRDAWRLGIAPKVLATHDTEFHFISEFLVGETLRPDSTRAKNLYPDIVHTLRTLHKGSSSCREFSLFNDIRLFMNGVDKGNLPHPEGLDEMLVAAYSIEEGLSKAFVPRGFCHNDLVPQNFIRTEENICLVDFDYAGNTWIAVDLACATSQFEMSEGECENFLKLYDEDLDDGQRGRLKALKFCNNLREASWAIMAEPMMREETNTFDDWSYGYHRDFNLEQARLAFSDQSFNEIRELACSVRPGALF